MAEPIVVLMGVSGSGKSSVGTLLARELSVPFLDGDSLHPPANVAKMAHRIPLTDEDRWPWLETVGRHLERAETRGIVMACSSLRRAYRDVLVAHQPRTLFVLLEGPRELLLERLRTRRGHFMPVELLDSQLETLQRPDPDERAIVIDIAPRLEQVVTDAAQAVTSFPPWAAQRAV